MLKLTVTFLTLIIASAQMLGQNKSDNYSVYINYATRPSVLGYNGRLYQCKGDTLSVMTLVRQGSISDPTINNIYDSTFYMLSDKEVLKLKKLIQSFSKLKSTFNPCIMDGLRFHFSCTLNDLRHEAWISNAYNSNIYAIIDIINIHVPKDLQIRYNKKHLKSEKKNCEKELGWTTK